MLYRQNALYDATQRVQHFLDLNDTILSVVDFSAARHWLDDIVTSFTEAAEEQGVSAHLAQGETAKQRHLRQKIRLELMAPISVVARWTLRGVPEFALLDTPKRSLHEQEFITQARCMADAASLYRDTLLAHGLPPTFLDDLQSAVALLADSLRERQVHYATHAGATRQLALAEQQGRAVLRVLDALVHRTAGDNQSLLRSWQAARHTGRITARTTTPATAAA